MRALENILHPKQLFASLDCMENEHWFFLRKEIFQQNAGWKLYISFNQHVMNSILIKLQPILISSNYSFKYIKSRELLNRLNAGEFGYSQVGKTLVIYLTDDDSEFIHHVIASMEEFRGTLPIVPFTKCIDEELGLSYRYGSYSSDNIEIQGESHKDNRDSASEAIPEGIVDCFSHLCRSESVDNALQLFLTQYVIVETLQQKARSGLFIAMNLKEKEYTEVILKYGYKNGGTLENGNDGCDLIRNEIWILQELQNSSLSSHVPKILDILDTAKHSAFVMEKIDGINLANLKQNQTISDDLLDAAWALIHQMHEEGLYWGDAKLGNFLHRNGKLYLVDFETAGSIAEPEPSTLTTFTFIDLQFDGPTTRDLFHFLASIMIEKGDEQDRHISVEKLIQTECTGPALWAQNKLSELYSDLVLTDE